jgi:succinoglycan biosynthesis transport protein ExoP
MLNPKPHPPESDGTIRVSALPRARTVADPGDITFLLGVARRSWRLILSVGAAGLILGACYYLVATPLYLASSRILIDFRRLSPVGGDNELLINFKVNDAAVDSQTTIIESEGQMRAVIERLALQDDPEFVGTARWWKSVLGVFGIVRNPGTMTGTERMQTAVETFRKRLKAQRVGISYVLEASFRSEDAAKAARVVDEVAAAYIRDQLSAKQDVATGANDWFSKRIQILNDQLAQAQNAAVAYRKNNQVMLAGGKFVDEQQVVEISARLTAARNERAQAESKLARIDEVAAGNKLDAGVGDELQNLVIVALRKKYFETARSAAENASRYGENHDAVVRMRANMKETEKAIVNEFQRIAQGYRSDAEVAKSREESLTREMETLAGRSVDAQKIRVEMTQLDSVVQSFQAIRDNFLSRYNELAQEQSFPITEARVLNKATVPQKAYAPRASLAFAGGSGVGLMAGFLLALCAEIFSRRARMRESVETVTGTPCLAWLPHLDKGKRNSRRDAAASGVGELPNLRTLMLRDPSRALKVAFQAARGRAVGLLGRLREKVAHWSPALAPPLPEIAREDHFEAVADAPFGIFAEGLRSIKIALNARFEGQRGVVLAFVSARPGEGSSTVAANFASLAAGAGQRTILMDVDLRRRTLSRRIAPFAEMGLQSVYRDLSRLLKAFSLFRGGVHFLPAVERDSGIHPSELIASAEMRQLTDLLRRTFDLIVLDLPPAVATIDGRAVADLVDAYVLVVEWNRTTLETLGEAMAENPQIARKLIGFAFNKVDVDEAKRIGDYAAVIDREYRERGSRPAVLGDAAARTA